MALSPPVQGYTHPPPFNTATLPVSDIHTIHFWESGNPTGKPVIFLHGGPGGGTTPSNATFFNPQVYRAIFLDQRGAGESTPQASIVQNTTHDIISDIEKLRTHLGIEKWFMVFGGSWGSTLAVRYAQVFPERTGCLVLRGVFCVRRSELANAYSPWGVWSQLFPERYEEFMGYLEGVLRGEGREGGVHLEDPEVVMREYYRLLCDEDPKVCIPAAKAWNKYEVLASTLVPNAEMMEKVDGDDVWNLQHARFECHYFVNGAWLEDGELLRQENLDKIKDIPCTIVQGRYDVVCPPRTAWQLHKGLPKSKLHIVLDAGHSATEPGTRAKLIEVCDEFAKL